MNLLFWKKTAGEAPEESGEAVKPRLLVVPEGDFVLASQRVPKRDAERYIRGYTEQLLGRDYYFCYVYSNGLLTFCSIKSPEYVAGRYCVLAPAMMTPGSYLFRQGKRQYLIEHDADRGASTDFSYDPPLGIPDVEELPLPQSLPSSMKLRWSMSKEELPVVAFAAAGFLVSVMLYGFASSSYDGVSRELQIKQMTKPVAPAPVQRGLPDISLPISLLAEQVGTSGRIEMVKGLKSEMMATIRFKSEREARDFISRNGGVYEKDNAVVVGFAVSGR